jgi:hypothetical protein
MIKRREILARAVEATVFAIQLDNLAHPSDA